MTTRNRKQETPLSNIKEKLDNKTKRTIIIFLILFVASFAFGVFSKDAIVSGMPSRENLNTETKEQFFIDINSDGLEDFIVYAEVIYNTGEENFLQGQQ